MTAVDATGAGDGLNGALAAALAAGEDLETAARRAVVAASLSVTRAGAREGYPTAAELDAALADPRASERVAGPSAPGTPRTPEQLEPVGVTRNPDRRADPREDLGEAGVVDVERAAAAGADRVVVVAASQAT